MSRIWIILTALLLAGLKPAGAVSFRAKRLQHLAECLKLGRLDTLSAGTHYGYQYMGHPLSVRVGDDGEIEHIGLLLFPESYRQQNLSPACDFAERNILERLTPNLGEQQRFRQAGEHVAFPVGTPRKALAIDTASVAISERRIDFKTYSVEWSREGRTLLSMTFDMDYQLLSGCDAEELEDKFMSKLKAFRQHEHRMLQPLFPKHSNVYVAAGDTFLIKEMRNDLYYVHDSDGWHLVDDAKNTSKALSNMLLSMDSEVQPLLQLVLSKSGYETDSATVPYKNWLQLCLDEGCTPFFGIKERTTASYKGTVLMSNPKAGYVHLLSVDVPVEAIGGERSDTIKGRLYAYIAMHNLSDNYFKLTPPSRPNQQQ